MTTHSYTNNLAQFSTATIEDATLREKLDNLKDVYAGKGHMSDGRRAWSWDDRKQLASRLTHDIFSYLGEGASTQTQRAANNALTSLNGIVSDNRYLRHKAASQGQTIDQYLAHVPRLNATIKPAKTRSYRTIDTIQPHTSALTRSYDDPSFSELASAQAEPYQSGSPSYAEIARNATKAVAGVAIAAGISAMTLGKFAPPALAQNTVAPYETPQVAPTNLTSGIFGLGNISIYNGDLTDIDLTSGTNVPISSVDSSVTAQTTNSNAQPNRFPPTRPAAKNTSGNSGQATVEATTQQADLEGILGSFKETFDDYERLTLVAYKSNQAAKERKWPFKGKPFVGLLFNQLSKVMSSKEASSSFEVSRSLRFNEIYTFQEDPSTLNGWAERFTDLHAKASSYLLDVDKNDTRGIESIADGAGVSIDSLLRSVAATGSDVNSFQTAVNSLYRNFDLITEATKRKELVQVGNEYVFGGFRGHATVEKNARSALVGKKVENTQPVVAQQDKANKKNKFRFFKKKGESKEKKSHRNTDVDFVSKVAW